MDNIHEQFEVDHIQCKQHWVAIICFAVMLDKGNGVSTLYSDSMTPLMNSSCALVRRSFSRMQLPSNARRLHRSYISVSGSGNCSRRCKLNAHSQSVFRKLVNFSYFFILSLFQPFESFTRCSNQGGFVIARQCCFQA